MSSKNNNQPLLYIESRQGGLFRGFGRCYPIITWVNGIWVVMTNTETRDWNWGDLVTAGEAERLFPGSTSALLPKGVATEMDMTVAEWIEYRPELFDDYDGPTMRRSPAEQEAFYAQYRELMPHLFTKKD